MPFSDNDIIVGNAPKQSTFVDPNEEGFWELLGENLETGMYNVLSGIGGSVQHLSELADKPGLNWIGKNAGRLASAARFAASDPDLKENTITDFKSFMASSIGQAVPYIGATLAARYFAGPLGAALTSFAIEGENAYQNALESGATQGEADTERLIVGGINALLETFIGPEQKLIGNMTKGTVGRQAITQLARNNVWKNTIAVGKTVTGAAIRGGLEEALEESLQGTVSEIVPKYLRDQQIPGGLVGFLSRRGLEAAGGGMMGAAMGGGSKLIGVRFDAPEEYSDAPVAENGGDVYPPMDFTLPEEIATAEGMVGLTEEPQLLLPETQSVNTAVVKTDPVHKMISVLDEAHRMSKEHQGEVAEARRKERGKRAGEFEKILQESEFGKENDAHATAVKELAGKYPSMPDFDPIHDKFSPAEISTLMRKIIHSDKIKAFDRKNAIDAFYKLFNKEGGIIPTRYEMNLLEKVYGKKLIRSIMRLRKGSDKAWEFFVDAINAPRAVMTSMDVSAMGRQGLFFSVRHPKIWGKNVLNSYRMFFAGMKHGFAKDADGKRLSIEASRKIAQEIETEYRTGKYYELAQKSKLAEESWLEEAIELGERSEFFMSHLAENIPGVERSEIAYVVGLNKLRQDIFAHYADKWEGTGKTQTDYDNLASFINHLTGRGDLPKFLKNHGALINGAFFSPRFFTSRFQIPLDVIKSIGRSIEGGKLDPTLTVAANELGSFVGTGLMVLGLMSMWPGVEVEPDPRSSDFGKIRVGDTRIDYWAGMSPIARLIAREAMGTTKATDTKRIYKISRRNEALRFLRSKLSPPAGLIVDYASGNTYAGDELTFSGRDIVGETIQHIAPLFIQDAVEAVRYSGMKGVPTIPLAFHGIGVQSYPISPAKKPVIVKNDIANEVFGQNWDALGPAYQKALRDYYPQIEVEELKAKKERENYGFLSRIAEEHDRAGKGVFNSLPKDIKSEVEASGYIFPGLSRRIGSNWYLNDKRYTQYQKLTSQYLNNALPAYINNPNWGTYSDETKRNILKKVVDTVKEMARQQVMSEANANDLYRGENASNYIKPKLKRRF